MTTHGTLTREISRALMAEACEGVQVYLRLWILMGSSRVLSLVVGFKRPNAWAAVCLQLWAVEKVSH